MKKFKNYQQFNESWEQPYSSLNTLKQLTVDFEFKQGRYEFTMRNNGEIEISKYFYEKNPNVKKHLFSLSKQGKFEVGMLDEKAAFVDMLDVLESGEKRIASRSEEILNFPSFKIWFEKSKEKFKGVVGSRKYSL
jgi:hypothetical protein